MKKSILILFISICMNIMSQKADLKWARTFGSGGQDINNSMVVDDNGNTYSTGYFFGVVDFDPDSAAAYNLTSAGNEDMYVLKLNSRGNLVWIRQIGAELGDQGHSICLDDEGNIIVTGVFSSNVDFNPDPSKAHYINSTGAGDAFVLKLSNEGHFMWVSRFGSTGTDNALSVTVDKGGNIYSGGMFSQTIDMDPGTGVFNLVSAGNADIFISKLDSAGKFKWAKQLGGPGYEALKSIYVNSDGNIFCNGDYSNLADFDPGIGKMLLTSTNVNGFIVKLDTGGNLAWVKKAPSNLVWGQQSDRSFTVDGSGNTYLTGWFVSVTDFNFDSTQAANITAQGNRDMFVLKLKPDGSFDWVKTIGNTSAYVMPNSLRRDGSDNLYVTGSFRGSVDFDPGNGTNVMTHTADYCIYVLKLDASGNFIWSRFMPGAGDGRSVSVDPYKNVYIAGSFSGVMDFDPDTVKVQKLSSRGGLDFSVLRLSQCQSSQSAITQTACKRYILNGKMYTASGYFEQVVANANGCDSTISINVTITKIDTGVYQNGNQLFTRISGPGYTFQWIDCKTKQPIVGKIYPSFNPSHNGEYAVVITYNNCNDTSACFAITNIGIDEPMKTSSVAVYPNPSNAGEMNLYIPQVIPSACLKIFNLQGRLVYENKGLSGGENRIDVSGLTPSVYFMEIHFDGGVSTIRLVRTANN